MSNVTTLRSFKTAKPIANKAKSASFRRRLRRQLFAANGITAVVFTLTALSLTHLAHGICIVTGAPVWECWAMAVGIDLGFISLELSTLCAATDAVRRSIKRFTTPAIVGTLGASAAMNAFAFGEALHGLMLVPAVALGVAVPALIYALMRIAAAMYLNCDR